MHCLPAKLLAALTVCTLLLKPVSAQQIPKIIPPSPNTASLMKFTDIPVSYHTGTSSITVPIYTIDAKGMQVPVSLNYHTGGIKLREEAGWAGLGWALTAGGSIARTILGDDDFGLSKSYFTNAVPQLAGDISATQDQPHPYSRYMFNFLCNYQVNTSGGVMDYYNALSTVPSNYELEPDIFSFNFPGNSGKFMITRDRKIIFEKQSNLKISFEQTGNSFTILDEKGNQFLFADKEYTYSGTPTTISISSWQLSRIVTYQRDTISFTYLFDNTRAFVPSDNYDTYSVFCSRSDFMRSSGTGTFYDNQLLQRIDFAGGQIQFEFDANRTDLQDAKKLNAIKLYSKTMGTLQYLRQFNLFYSYFNENPTGNAEPREYKRLKLDSVQELSGTTSIPSYKFTYVHPSPEAITGKHAYSADHWGFFNGIANTTFIPTSSTYYSPPLATFGVPNSPAQYFNYPGANRKADPVAMQAFSLQEVRYPTQGRSVLSYEANDYDHQRSITGPQDFPMMELVNVNKQVSIAARGVTTTDTVQLRYLTPIAPVGTGTRNITVGVAFRCNVLSSNLPYRNSFGKIYVRLEGPGVNETIDISNSLVECPGNSFVCSATFQYSITSNTQLICYGFIDNSVGTDFEEIRVNFSYQAAQAANNIYTNNDYTVKAGGLRVKSITDYADETTIAKKRVFEYNYFNGAEKHTHGRLMSFPSYARYEPSPNGFGGVCNYMILTGSSNSSVTGVMDGNIVGYDQVTEYTVDPVTGVDNGKTVYTYFNSPDTVLDYGGFKFPGMLSLGNNLNGSLLSTTNYARIGNGYKKVTATFNHYHAANRSIFYSPRYSGLPGQPQAEDCPNGSPVAFGYLACMYPSIKSERVLLDSTIELNYDQQNESSFVKTSKYYYYDNPAHYQLTRLRSADGKGNTIIQANKYVQDYLPAGSAVTNNTVFDAMLTQNMVALIVEKRDSLFYTSSASGWVNGAELSRYKLLPTGNLVVDTQYKLDIREPVNNFQGFSINGNSTNMDTRYKPVVNFSKYDSKSNITQYVTVNQLPVSIIWDHSQIYPIAEIMNADNESVAYTSFEADGSGNWTIASSNRSAGGVTGNACYQLSNGSISKGGLQAASTYIVSYWCTNNTPYSIGGTQGSALKGKTVNGWTYFEHTVTGVTQVSLPQMAGLIDELRLHPALAQMTTYTYAPLYGRSASCSPNNTITYYEYDALGRLQALKDQNGNVVKTMEYYYKRN